MKNLILSYKLFIALAAVLFTVQSSDASLLSKPVAMDYPDVPENSLVNIECYRVDAAMWYEFYVQKDGQPYLATFIRGDDAGLPEDTVPVLSIGSPPPGQYQFWVRAWEPVYGLSEWSDPDEFEVTGIPVQQCAPTYPTESNVVASGTWPAAYVFNDPAINPTATWGWLQIFSYNTEAYVFDQWVEYDFPGQNGIAASDIPNLELLLPDGGYDWYCREYSAWAGAGEVSDVSWGDIQGTDCSSIDPLESIPFLGGSVGDGVGEHLYHASSMTVQGGNTPSLELGFGSVPWIRVLMVEENTNQVVFDEWIRWIDDYNKLMPKLAPGDYAIYTQSFHYQCGASAWSAEPVAGFEVASVEIGSTAITGVEIDRRGILHASLTSRQGIDWYQCVVTSGDKVILNQWFDLESRMPSGKQLLQSTTFEGEVGFFNDWVLILDEAYGGPFTFYCRSYSLGGELEEWQQTEVFSPAASNKIAPLNLASEPGALTWDAGSVDDRGIYELYFQRNGEYYYEDTVEARFVSQNPTYVPWDDEWERPTSYESFFDFAPGDYSVWIRSAAGPDGASPWSDPLEFSTYED